MLDNYVTWEVLASFAGATTITAVLTQLLKDSAYKYLKIPVRLLSYLISLVVILLSLFFTTGLNASVVVLSVFNALIVSLASNGGYDLLKNTVSSVKTK